MSGLRRRSGRGRREGRTRQRTAELLLFISVSAVKLRVGATALQNDYALLAKREEERDETKINGKKTKTKTRR